MAFYRLDEIHKHNALYNVLIGERSNGKSTACKEKAIREAFETKTICSALIRRYDEDIKSNVMSTYFDDTYILDLVKKLSKGAYDSIVYYQRRFYFAKYDEDKDKYIKGFAFCVCFSLASAERYKSSTVFPSMRYIIFEEFATANRYLKNEVTVFMNLISTLLRLTEGRVYMISNKVSRVCPYYVEWNLHHIPKQVEGSIDEYIFKGSDGNDVKICVEMCASSDNKKSGMFFGRIGKQIDNGAWETKEHPHLEGDLSEYDILYSLSLTHMSFSFNILLLSHSVKGFLCVYIYPSTVKTFDRVLTNQYSTNPQHSPTLNAKNKAERLINELRKNNKVVFPTNLVGEDFESTIKNMNTNPFMLL